MQPCAAGGQRSALPRLRGQSCDVGAAAMSTVSAAGRSPAELMNKNMRAPPRQAGAEKQEGEISPRERERKEEKGRGGIKRVL